MREIVSAQVAARAQRGDREAMEEIARGLGRPLYNLALRMLADPLDAQDATQEILIKIVARVGAFRGESAFTTWAYRVATNHLLTQRERGLEKAHLPFEKLGEVIDEGLQYASPSDPQDPVLVSEARMACTHAMLVCLERDQRLVYILGEILEMTSDEGAAILEIEPAAFRKRLSRARERIQAFMSGRCGLVNADAVCRCSKQVAGQIRLGLLKPQKLRFAGHPVREQTQRIGDIMTSVEVFRGHPDYAPPEAWASKVRDLLHQVNG